MAYYRSFRGRLSVVFEHPAYGRREESLHLADTKDNRRVAEQIAQEISAELTLRRFDYASRFKKSKFLRRLGITTPAIQAAPDKLGQCVRDWLQELKGGDTVRPQTHYCYARQLDHVLRHSIADMPMPMIDDGHLNKFMADLKAADLGSSVRIAIVARLKTIFALAQRRKKINDNPMLYVTAPKRQEPNPNPLTGAEARALIDESTGQDKVIVIVALTTGMRPGECFGLKWCDIDWRRGMVHVQRTRVRKQFNAERWNEPKTKKSKRPIILGEAALKALREQQARTRLLPGGWVFANSRGEPLDPDGWRDRVWKRTLEKAGLELRVFMQARHTFGAVTMGAGKNELQDIAQVMGHSNTRMLHEVYGKWGANRRGTAAQTMDGILSDPNSHIILTPEAGEVG